jgi:hypothetical protein
MQRKIICLFKSVSNFPSHIIRIFQSKPEKQYSVGELRGRQYIWQKHEHFRKVTAARASSVANLFAQFKKQDVNRYNLIWSSE